MNYKIGVPSYVIPGTWLENIQFLENRTDIHAIELLLFLWDKTIRSDFLHELEAIQQFKNRFIFTLHLPDANFTVLEEIIALTNNCITAYCVHPPQDSTKSYSFAASLISLEQRYQKPVLLENTTLSALEYVLACYQNIQPNINPGLCMDTAHLLVEGIAPVDFVARYGKFIKTVHLNDYEEQQEHKPISSRSDWIIPCIPFFKQFTGILEVELFSIHEIDTSLLYFNTLMKGSST